MKRPYGWITVAVIISAFAPAGILAYQIWDGKTYLEVTKHRGSPFRGDRLKIGGGRAKGVFFASVL